MNFKIESNKRNILISFLATTLIMISLIFLFSNTHAFAQNGKIKIIVHYAKNPSNNLKSNIWLWTDKKSGNTFNFTKNDAFGYVSEIELDAGFNRAGFAVCTVDGKRDIEKNRFIEKFNNGASEVWVIEGDSKVYDSAAEATATKNEMETQVNIKKQGGLAVATLDDLNNISIETNLLVPYIPESIADITVKADGKVLKIKKVANNETKDGKTSVANIELNENVDLSQNLTISKKGFAEKQVELGKIFNSVNFEKNYYYEGNDLGNTYSTSNTSFRVWAPTAREVKVVIYKKWDDKSGTELSMKKSEKGTWTYDLPGDQKGLFYTYKVNVGETWNEAVDPYARSVSANGDKGAVIDLDQTTSETWKPSEKPKFENLNDAIIYELHVRDFSIDKNSGIKNKGKFLAFTETGTKGIDGKPTGMDYIKSLGVTHVDLMPIFDYASVDETSTRPQFNWGYNPKNYNSPEGSYSTDPYNPIARVKELKQGVQSFHDNGLRVIMDVAYSQMYSSYNSNFNKIVPGYYFKGSKEGANINESGSTIVSQNAMARKFIVDSVEYWAKEYNMDGFRFNYMGTLDVKTMNEIRKKLSSIDPSILIIGESSDLGTTLPKDIKATKTNASKMPDIAQFNNVIKDAIKGSVFVTKDKGFVSGKSDEETNIKKGIVGGIDYSSTIKTWGNVDPEQFINYVETHDDYTLWDKLLLTNPEDNNVTRLKMHKMADSMILTSQGIPFLQAGQEFIRTKSGDNNSYNSNDSVNKIDWVRKSENKETVDYFKGLIELRKAHPAFRMTSADMVKKNLKFLIVPKNVVAYEMNYNANMDTWAHIVVAYNANKEDRTVKLSKKGTWNIVVDGQKAGVKTIKQFNGGSLVVPGLSTVVIYYQSNNIFITLNFWIYVICTLGGIVCIIMFFKYRKKA
ncbi:type I pullulanase [Clostridium algoriphilum]|uniref:type I pullulanase n=1 Tax=Clostridium algoriphilum TaxID=198347 RepID=UPI001CF57421|nr:type I pullulanase [Clostridium algoriphilum]MCB2292231.1 type I pullulanase [Clostridium algoriphilum]